MSLFMVFPLTMQAEAWKECNMMKSEDGKHMMGKPGGMKGHHDWLSSLDLDEDVLQKIKESKLKHKEKIIELKNQLEKKKLEMEKVLIEKKLNFNKIFSIHDEMANLKHKISRKKIEQKIEMYKLLPDDKKEKAKGMLLHKFLRKGHGGLGMHGKHGDTNCPMEK